MQTGERSLTGSALLRCPLVTATAAPSGTPDVVPPGWYDDPYGTDAERFHDGTRWTGRTRVPTSPEVTADRPIFPPAPSRPRPTWQRRLITAPVAAAALAVALSPLLQHRWGYITCEVVSATVVATVGRRVSLGWWSVFWALTWPWIGLAYVTSVAWRLSYWPYRDWEMASDHGPNWVRVTHPSVKGALWIRRDSIDTADHRASSEIG
jgi:hypothetical protein